MSAFNVLSGTFKECFALRDIYVFISCYSGKLNTFIVTIKMFRKLEGVVGTGWSWLRIGTVGGHL
jgi:hypothetical protein